MRRYLGEMSIPFIEKHSIYGKELLFNYEEIQNILEEENHQILQYFYFNKENIHDILYKENKIISIENILTKNLHELFYLDLFNFGQAKYYKLYFFQRYSYFFM